MISETAVEMDLIQSILDHFLERCLVDVRLMENTKDTGHASSNVTEEMLMILSGKVFNDPQFLSSLWWYRTTFSVIEYSLNDVQSS